MSASPSVTVVESVSKGFVSGVATVWLLRILLFVVVIALWELTAVYLVDPFWIGRPDEIAVRLLQFFQTGDLVKHAGATLMLALWGLLLSLVVGIPIGILFGSSAVISETIEPYFLGLYSLPRVALAPLFILWFGIGEFSKIMMSFSMIVFVVILNTYEGLRNTDQEMVDMLRAMRASRLYILRKVLLPSIVPWIFAAIRVGIGLGLVGAVVGELLGANRGLGWYLEYSAARLDITGVFAALAVLMVLGMVLNEIIKFVEFKIWRSKIS